MGVMLQSDMAGDLLTKTTLSPTFASAINPRDQDGHNLDATYDTLEPTEMNINAHADGGRTLEERAEGASHQVEVLPSNRHQRVGFDVRIEEAKPANQEQPVNFNEFYGKALVHLVPALSYLYGTEPTIDLALVGKENHSYQMSYNHKGTGEPLLNTELFVHGSPSQDPKGAGKMKGVRATLRPWQSRDVRSDAAFLQDFELLVPQKPRSKGSGRCKMFGLFVHCAERKARVTEFLDLCTQNRKKPRWVNLRKAFVMGAENACAYITAAIPRVQTLQQNENETPTGYISRLRGERTRLIELAKGTPLANDVANTLTDRAVIRTFHSGLTVPKYQLLKETIMRGTLSTTSSAATITTLADLASEVSREMAVTHPNLAYDLPAQPARRQRGTEVVLSRIGFDAIQADKEPSSDSDTEQASYNADRTC